MLKIISNFVEIKLMDKINNNYSIYIRKVNGLKTKTLFEIKSNKFFRHHNTILLVIYKFCFLF